MNLGSIIKEIWHQPLFTACLAMLSCFCFFSLTTYKNQTAKFISLIYYGLFSLSVLIFAFKIIDTIRHPEVFDFTAFYLYGKVAAAGYNYYLPENFQSVFKAIADLPLLDYAIFKEEIVGTGFLYPPPSIFLFVPLGFLSIKTALICWTIFTLAFVPACIYLSYTLFFAQHKLNGLLLVSSLFFLLSPARDTVVFSQTNFILLFLLLLMKKNENKNFAGIFLALAMFTKPYMVVFFVYFLLRKNWGAILFFITTCLLITGATFLVFGKEVFISYLFDNPTKRLPLWVFRESINQSLHAVLLRANLITMAKPLVYYGILIAGFSITGAYLLFLLKRKLYDFIWAVLLLTGLLFYPGTLSYYGTLLLFVVYQFFTQQNQLGFGRNFTIGLIGIFYFLSCFSLFFSVLFFLSMLVYKSLFMETGRN